jgi:tetratricopeptide (TPR) repeat protein
MPRKKSGNKRQESQQPASSQDPRREGMRAFMAQRFGAAIAAWSQLDQRDAKVREALAEAYFRRALTHADMGARADDMRQALELVPHDVRYRYHRGLALHRAGKPDEAAEHYRAVLDESPAWSGAGLALALAELEQDSAADLEALPGSTPALLATLEPLRALLRGEVPPVPDDSDQAVQMLWHGLGLLQAGDPAARSVLRDDHALSSLHLHAMRQYYQGVAAAQAGDMATAVHLWWDVYQTKIVQPTMLEHNLTAGLIEVFQARLDAGTSEEVADLAVQVVESSLSHAALNGLLLAVFDRAAHAAAGAADWRRAVQLWGLARGLMGSSASLGSPRPLLHNLALAYEHLENWRTAADTWRALLRARPRKARSDEERAADPFDYTDEQWAWIRSRVITCYQNAGEPGEAVKVFRQAIKKEPEDLDLRIQLVDALLANDQEQAAFNQIDQVLDRNPRHIEANLRLANLYGAGGQWNAAERALRIVLDQQPEREDVRRQVARVMLMRGNYLHNVRMLDQAERVFAEGQQFAPDDYQFPLNLARIAIDRRNLEQAEGLLERALELAGDYAPVYVAAIDCWAVAGDIGRVRAMIERAERVLGADVEFYTELAISLLQRSSAPPPLSSFLFGGTPAPAPKDDELIALAEDVLNRAVALRPDDPQLRFRLASELLNLDAELALQHAEAGVQLMPDEPSGLLLLGLLQGLTERDKEARATLRKAAKLARKRGDEFLAQQAEMLQQQVGSPMLRFSLQMGLHMDDEMLDELDDLDDLDDDFFF